MLSKVMRFFQTGIPRFYRVVVVALFWVILLYFSFLSAVSTSFVNSLENTFFCQDSILLNLCAAAAVMLFCLFFKKWKVSRRFLDRLEQEEALFRHCRRVLLLVIFLLSVVWVLSTQYDALADQRNVQQAVYDFQAGNYQTFRPGNYMAAYQNQLGLFWLSYLFSLIFGSQNYVAFQIMNAVAVTLFYRELSQLGRYFGWRRGTQLSILLMGVLFYPLLMYCSFVYGNLLGLACSVLAIRLELQFFQTHQKRFAFFSAGAILLALLWKSNYLIFLVGMILYALVETFRQKKGKLLLLPVLVAAAFLVQSFLPVALARQATGQPFDQPMSSWSWIAMGLQRESPFAPGWYNGYNVHSFGESNGQTEIQTQLAKQDIQQSLRYFWQNKGEALQFFTLKTASEWNNPTFQSYWLTENHQSSAEESNWLWQFTSPWGEYYGTLFLNLFQFVILAGALLYCLLDWKKSGFTASLILAMIFVGGAAFHLVWEAKAQYTLSYFVLLFPYAAAGYSRFADCGLVLLGGGYGNGHWKNVGRRWRKNLVFLGALFAVMAVFIGICYSGGRVASLRADTGAYLEYVQLNSGSPALAQGDWALQIVTGAQLQVESTQNEDELVLSTAPDSEAGRFWVSNYGEKTRFYCSGWQSNLCFAAEEDEAGQPVFSLAAYDRSDQQVWRVTPGRDGSVVIAQNGNALTYDAQTGRVFLAPADGSENQQWYPVAIE